MLKWGTQMLHRIVSVVPPMDDLTELRFVILFMHCLFVCLHLIGTDTVAAALPRVAVNTNPSFDRNFSQEVRAWVGGPSQKIWPELRKKSELRQGI